MSEANTTHHADEDAAGRHRGQASPDENDSTQAPHGKHRRPQEG
jgi:hypothetical protein